MGLFFAIWLFILGMLAASNLIIARKPDAKEIIARFAPYQGWMGVVALLSGIYNFTWSLSFFGVDILAAVTFTATSVVLIVLGFLLGVGTLKTFVKAPAATEKLDTVVAKLAPLQGTFGLVGMGLAVWGLVYGLLF
jgi:hypothetical protein